MAQCYLYKYGRLEESTTEGHGDVFTCDNHVDRVNNVYDAPLKNLCHLVKLDDATTGSQGREQILMVLILVGQLLTTGHSTQPIIIKSCVSNVLRQYSII
jgi:hypothetical protein